MACERGFPGEWKINLVNLNDIEMLLLLNGAVHISGGPMEGTPDTVQACTAYSESNFKRSL